MPSLSCTPPLSPAVRFSSFTPPPPTAIYTLSLHDALPISRRNDEASGIPGRELASILYGRNTAYGAQIEYQHLARIDRKSTRLNSSHLGISYAVFCLKKKKTKNDTH